MNEDASRNDPDATRSLEPAGAPQHRTIGRYELVEKIGEGGMGEVWVAKQSEPVKRKVALKLIKQGMDSRAVVQRFEQERQALAVMDHPNIAKVLDGGLAENGQPYFVMELVSGRPLVKFCDQQKLSIRQRLELFVPICQAVQHAHQKGVIHRDLKPSNILVSIVDGRPVPKVIDFGLAKAVTGKLIDDSLSTHVGAVVGTLEYMAPEQAGVTVHDIDTRADVYSLGVILYELLTGLRPFDLRRAAIDEMIRVIREVDPPSLASRLSTDASLPSTAAVRQTEPKRLVSAVKGELDWIARRCLEKDRDRRYETASGLARDVERYLADEPVEARPVSAAYRLHKFFRRHKGPVTAAGLVALTLVGGVVGTTWGMLSARAAEQREFDRAEGERLAKIDAQEAKAQAINRLAQVERGNEILAGIFKDLDIRRVKRDADPLEAVLAKKLIKAAEQVDGQSIGDEIVVAKLQNHLGVSINNLGFGREAAAVLEKATNTLRTMLGADRVETVASVTNLATALSTAGRYKQALPLYEESFKRLKAELGPDHRDSLSAMSNLARGLANVGDFDRALPLFKEALELQRKSLGPDDPNTLQTVNNLATAFVSAGNPEHALPLYEKALELRKSKLGADHLDTLESMNNLANALADAGLNDRAIRLYEETLGMSKVKKGRDHPQSLTTMDSLAASYWSAGRMDESLAVLEEMVGLVTARQGRDHPGMQKVLINLGTRYRDAGRTEKAIPILEEAAARPNAPPWVANVLAGAYEQAGEHAKLSDMLRKELAQTRKTTPAGDRQLVEPIEWLANKLLPQNKFDEAAPLLQEALSIREKSEPNTWTTFNTRSLLGFAKLRQGRFVEAEPLLVQAYDGLQRVADSIPADSRSRVLSDALDRLIELYTATNKPDEVKKWKAERAKYPSAKETKSPAAKSAGKK